MMTVPLTIRLSEHGFWQENLGQQLISIAEEVGLSQQRLPTVLFSISEEVLIKQPERGMKQIEALQSLGMGVVIHHFGLGRLSLQWLYRFQPMRVELDVELFHCIEKAHGREKVVKAILCMARELGIEIVANGVEEGVVYQFLQQQEVIGMGGSLMPPISLQQFQQLQP